VGDIMLGDHPLRIGRGVGSTTKARDSTYLFKSAAPFLRKGDIVFGNLEAVLSNAGLEPRSIKSAQIRGTPESIEGLMFAGFNVLSLANNHTLDHGQPAFEETVRLLSENGIESVGVTEGEESFRPTFLHRKGLSIAFLACCATASPNRLPLPCDWADRLAAAVQDLVDSADITIVSIHWGDEFIQFPSPSQVRLARHLVDSGAHLVLGHHPHVLQAVERHGKGLICYSLGNFIFDMWQLTTRESLILRCEVSPEGVEEFELVPVFIGDDYVPRILRGEAKQKLTTKMDLLNEHVARETLEESAAKTQQYEMLAARNRARYRRELKVFFVSRLLTYRPVVAYQLFMTGVRGWLAALSRKHKSKPKGWRGTSVPDR
jgi:poly-gamma-glutamate synthesis protein (capsule biosynthesis protein)